MCGRGGIEKEYLQFGLKMKQKGLSSGKIQIVKGEKWREIQTQGQTERVEQSDEENMTVTRDGRRWSLAEIRN